MPSVVHFHRTVSSLSVVRSIVAMGFQVMINSCSQARELSLATDLIQQSSCISFMMVLVFLVATLKRAGASKFSSPLPLQLSCEKSALAPLPMVMVVEAGKQAHISVITRQRGSNPKALKVHPLEQEGDWIAMALTNWRRCHQVYPAAMTASSGVGRPLETPHNLVKIFNVIHPDLS